jgi:hypothetical protein
MSQSLFRRALGTLLFMQIPAVILLGYLTHQLGSGTSPAPDPQRSTAIALIALAWMIFLLLSCITGLALLLKGRAFRIGSVISLALYIVLMIGAFSQNAPIWTSPFTAFSLEIGLLRAYLFWAAPLFLLLDVASPPYERRTFWYTP